jgi:hypothetical protein
MKTLLWTGAAMGLPTHGQSIVFRWWNYYRVHREAMDVTHFAAFNDGDKNLPVELFVRMQNANSPASYDPFSENCLNLVYWPDHIGFGDPPNLHRRGFWRNVFKAVEVCQQQDFDRMILIEADTLIMGPDMLFEIGKTTTGATAYWCPAHGIPESSICIFGKDKFQALADFASDERRRDKGFESGMDWTEVRKHRVGDRYPEWTQSIPTNAEYCVQVMSWALLRWGGKLETFRTRHENENASQSHLPGATG